MNCALEEVDRADTRLPATNVGIERVRSLCTAIEKADGLKPGKVRLPTASEWTYVSLAGETQSNYIQENWRKMARVEAPGLSEVCNYLPNRWGIFDLFGNAEEWVIDGEADEWELPSNRIRIISKGGNFGSHWQELDAANEHPGGPPDCGAEWQGFRLVIVD